MRSDGENYLSNMKTKYITPDERQILANTVRVQEVPNAEALTMIQRTSANLNVDLNSFGMLLRCRSSLYRVKANTTMWTQ